MRKMPINISSGRLIKDIQDEFSQVFPFLKIEFQRLPNALIPHSNKVFALPDDIIRHASRINSRKAIEITPSITVRELEEFCEESFGIYVQFYRKSGNLWLKITMTDNWTMKQQNELGSEISTLFETNKQY